MAQQQTYAPPRSESLQERSRRGFLNQMKDAYLSERDASEPTAVERYVSPFQMAGEASLAMNYLFLDQKVFSAIAMLGISFIGFPLFNRVILTPTQEGVFGLLPLVILYTLSWLARLRHVVFDGVIAFSWFIISFLSFPILANLLAIGYFTTLGPATGPLQWVMTFLFASIAPALGGLYLFCVYISLRLIFSAILLGESKP